MAQGADRVGAGVVTIGFGKSSTWTGGAGAWARMCASVNASARPSARERRTWTGVERDHVLARAHEHGDDVGEPALDEREHDGRERVSRASVQQRLRGSDEAHSNRAR